MSDRIQLYIGVFKKVVQLKDNLYFIELQVMSVQEEFMSLTMAAKQVQYTRRFPQGAGDPPTCWTHTLI